MAILKVARLGHPVLRQMAREVPVEAIESAELQRFVRDLRETMLEYEGVGLAAPQVFESIRVFAMITGTDEDAAYRRPATVWINPQLHFPGSEEVQGWEGCLSIPDLRGLVTRQRVVEVSGFDETGKAHRIRYEGFPAIVAQHENDHLDGRVFLDRMTDFSSLSFLREFERFHLASADEDEE